MKLCVRETLLAVFIFAYPAVIYSQSPLQNPQLNDTLYTLPVVVHVINTGTPIGSADNPDDASIIAMIDNLNNAWRKNGPSFGGPDMKIQFQLAVRSPSCGPTNGINRINGSVVPNYATGGITNINTPGSADEVSVKNLSRWPNTDYINIWIVNKINGDPNYPGGYTYFPELNSAMTDGLVLNASVVDATNKTIAHEMGHHFYLYHTFEGYSNQICAANTDCLNQGDLICDTEPCLLETDCSNTINSCTGVAYQVADATHNYTVLNNYMGYTNCQWMFTDGQKTRARSALFTYRPGLISSWALTTPTGSAPAAACIPTAAFALSPYYGIQQVDFNTIHIYSNTSLADNSFYVDRTCNQSTIVIEAQSYSLTVTGSYLNPHYIKAYIDYNNDGDFNDAGENVLDDLNGSSSAIVTIPATGVPIYTPIRMRIVADNPGGSTPSACQLFGNSGGGSGQVEDYALIIIPRQIYSIASGAWNVPATWSCNCIPQNDDEVTVKATHTVTITSAMGAQQCGKLILDPGSIFNAGDNLKIIGTH